MQESHEQEKDAIVFKPGERITHQEFGIGVIIEEPADGYVRALFSNVEYRVPLESVKKHLSRTKRILQSVLGTSEQLLNVRLSYESHSLLSMENSTVLTSAPIDLLPHQITLTHKVALASPRRFLIADEVGLGKTIETALILRELASRGELDRVLLVVPAGLVNNWENELNQVFKLDFEVFGAEGDVTDRKSNAFAKHDRLIASIDTLKKSARIQRILLAPPWDLVVFDEAHHLTAHNSGGKVRKTENYKLGEALKDHTRDLIFLSATPHQGNHFQFWMLMQLLNPSIFSTPEEMITQRHRLNAVMFRRTKADACKPNGEPLFARRQVYTESFVMNNEETEFYEKLRVYLNDGFDIARRQGNKGQALGFIMAIFQKIASSSFYAVQNTLRQRLLMLSIYESQLRDTEMDIEERDKLINEAKELIKQKFQIANKDTNSIEIDHILADLRYKVSKKINEDLIGTEIENLENNNDSYFDDVVGSVDAVLIPEERNKIYELLSNFPETRETKVQKLLDGLGALWRQNPNEKIVIFVTYLGTVELLQREINIEYPGQGVEVLRGGDHGMKVAAVRRFGMKDGPKILICTTAGREGINLQFARVLFNFDMPWNPMDLEQRIGRIHRYGQNHTAQIYNLILSDTIEGRIFLLLDEKLEEISKTLGKVDSQGKVEENLKIQILGQLSERLNYDRIFQDALSDPELKRTSQELEVALTNAKEAREVVFELFQDLERFQIDDYIHLPDLSNSIKKLLKFLKDALVLGDKRMKILDHETVQIESKHKEFNKVLTLNRESANSNKNIELIGLDHPLVKNELIRWNSLRPEKLGVSVKGYCKKTTLLSVWKILISKDDGSKKTKIIPIAVDENGVRSRQLELQIEETFNLVPTEPMISNEQRISIFERIIEPTLQRELKIRGIIGEGSYSSELIGYLEIQCDQI